MTIAYWCVLAAALLPYIWVGAAKSAPGYDNAAPRAFLDTMRDWRQRAVWAQLNAFEALPAFAAAVIIAHQLSAPQVWVNFLALGFIGLRLVHGIAYIGGWPRLRSLAWLGGMGCIIALFAVAT